MGVGPDGGRFDGASDLAAAVASRWPATSSANRFVVCTGGEPLLQLDAVAVDALHAEGFTVAVETNGTQAAPPGIDWICVSPKAQAPLVIERGNELKLVYPQAGVDPEPVCFACPSSNFFLQPMDGPDAVKNTQLAVAYCLSHPIWRLSIQTHKLLGIR